MPLTENKALKYTIYGTISGMAFPILATTLEIILLDRDLSFRNIWLLQAKMPTLWMLDAVPFLFGLLAYLIGQSKDTIIQLNDYLEQEVSDRMTDLALSNRKLETKVAELMQSEVVLNASLQKYAQLFRKSSYAMALVSDRTSEILEVNQQMLSLFGYSAEEMRKLNLSDLADKNITPLEQLDSCERLDFVRKNGEVFHAEIALNSMEISGAAVSQVAMSKISDRTKSREIEISDRETHQLTAGFDAIPAAILILGEKSTFYNRSFSELWETEKYRHNAKISPDELTEKISTMLKDRSEFVATVRHLEEHPTENCSMELELATGKMLDCHSVPIEKDNNPSFGRLWFYYDISELNAKLSHLNATKNQAEVTSQAQVGFILALRSELKETMSSMVGISKVLLDTELSEAQHNYTRRISELAYSLTQTISEIDSNQMDSDRTESQTTFSESEHYKEELELSNPELDLTQKLE